MDNKAIIEQIRAVVRGEAAELIRSAVNAALGKGVDQGEVRRIIRQLVPNFLIGMDPTPPCGDTEAARLGYDEGRAVWRTERSGGGSTEDYHFRVEAVAVYSAGGEDHVQTVVHFGTWTRNGYLAPLYNSVDTAWPPQGDSESAPRMNDYIWIILHDEVSDTPEISPTHCHAEYGPSVPDDKETKGIVLVLGKFTAGVWEQYWKGGDFDDWYAEAITQIFNTTNITTEDITPPGTPPTDPRTIGVSVGAWTRNGHRVTLPASEGLEYCLVSGVGYNDYVWLNLGGTEHDPSLWPSLVTVEHGAEIPTDIGDETIPGTIWILGKYTYGVWKRWWFGGDIDDWIAIPDGKGNPAENVLFRSLKFRDDDSVKHTGELSLWDFNIALDQTAAFAETFAAGVRTLRWYYPVKVEGSPVLTGSGAGPSGASTNCKVVSAYPTSPSFSLAGNTLKLSLNFRDFRVGDGRLDMMAQEEATSIDIDLTSILSPGGTGPYDHTDITDWDEAVINSVKENIAHGDLSDMPDSSGTNGDHDGRYWPAGVADDGDYSTSGTVEASTVEALSNFICAGQAGATLTVVTVDPTTGNPVTLNFVGGILVEG